jgi:hypothetical protein
MTVHCEGYRSSPNRGDSEAVGEAEQHQISRLDGWSPAWVGARSLAVAQSRQGDREPLRHFIDVGLQSDECEAASLNYWAYWAGETTGTYHADSFMATGDLGPWRGTTLLRRLRDNLAAGDPYTETSRSPATRSRPCPPRSPRRCGSSLGSMRLGPRLRRRSPGTLTSSNVSSRRASTRSRAIRT